MKKVFSFLFRKGPHYGAKKAFLIIFSSTALLFIIYLVPSLSFSYQKEGEITKLILKQQTAPVLTPLMFMELLSLNKEQLPSYSAFDVEAAKKALQNLHLFKKISLKKCKEEALYIKYELSQPLYIWGDQPNQLMNAQGKSMPYFPYFSPQRLPLLYLGSENFEIQRPYLEAILSSIPTGEVEMIDLRQVNATSKAHREVILKIKQTKATHLLRIDPASTEKALQHYAILLTHFTQNKQSNLVIDLRFSESAYLTILL